MTQPTPYLTFRGQARHAMEFYRSIFGGELEIREYGEFGFGSGASHEVMHASLRADDFQLMASDTPPGRQQRQGSQINLALTGTKRDEERLRGWFDGLADGGTVHTPLEPQPWGDLYGELTDRFGIRWMVDIRQEG